MLLERTPAQPNPWSALWQTITRFEKDKLNPWIGLRNAVGITLPLAIGVAVDSVSAGVVMATGALNVAFSDSTDPYLQRAFRMLAATVMVSIAVAAGGVSALSNISSVALATAWAFAAGLLVALNTTAADLGVISLVTLVVFAAQPLTPERALYSGLLAFGGGLLQTSLSLLFWPVRRYEPERRALAHFFSELFRAAASPPASAAVAPPASAASTQAQHALEALDRDHSIEAERYRMLLSQAERMRLSLLALSRLRTRLQREEPDCPELPVLDRGLAVAAELLAIIAQALSMGRPAESTPELLSEFQSIAEHLRQGCHAMVRDARFQMDALGGQLRSAIDLAASATPKGLENFQTREAAQPWGLRLSSALATVRANLSLGSTGFRHALRMAACIMIGDTIARGFDLRRSYWLPMTVAIVLKPDFTATFSRGVLRLAGTFIGLVLSTALFHVLHPSNAAILILMALVAFALRWLGPANYGVLVICITAYVVLLLALTGVAPADTISARGLNTLIGGSLCLIAYWIWPTWERKQVKEMGARLLDAYRVYFRAIRDAYTQTEESHARQLDRARLDSRLARSNLEGSADRLIAEPRVTPDEIHTLGAVLASSHRLVHAMMALEAGLSRSHPVPARAAFRALADHIELTLYYLAAGLRGSPLDRAHLPDLREDHHALVTSGDALTERYALVNVETDRITNSLNTLTEEILRWLEDARPPASNL